MKRFSLILVVLSLFLGLSAPISAQDASPEAQASLLANLGFEDLIMETDGLDFSMPATVESGRFRFVINNVSSDRSADVVFALVPDGMTSDDVIALARAADQQDVPPAEVFSLTFAGGAYAFPESSGDSILTLTPGDWVIDFSAYSETDDSISFVTVYKKISVTGELPNLTEPAADVVAVASDLQFDMPETIATGPHVWQFTNAGSFLHHMVIYQYPGLLTEEQVQAGLNMRFGVPATPQASPVAAIDPEQYVFTTQGQLLSSGQSNWYQIDLSPGTYVVFCFLSGPGEVPMHALMGMFKIFTVE
ncbi:MAG: hypothetical protein AB7V46_08620 [Thermomicrobiales bacterium]